MDVRPINTEADYDWALKEIEQYFENEPELGSPEAARFDVLSTLIEAYEDQHWRIEADDPVAAIHEAMQQAWLLHREWKIPAEILLRRWKRAKFLRCGKVMGFASLSPSYGLGGFWAVR